jgi:hypothetical protein
MGNFKFWILLIFKELASFKDLEIFTSNSLGLIFLQKLSQLYEKNIKVFK